MNRRRGSNGFGVNPLSFSEIESFFNLHQIDVLPEEITIIEMLDDVVLSHYAKEMEKERNKNKNKKK